MPEDVEQAEAEPATEKPAATTFDAETVNWVQNEFPSAMYIQKALFGVENECSAHRVRTDSGKITDADVADAISSYITPGTFAEARLALSRDRVVVLYGPADIGKRASAIALLREVTDRPLFRLAPSVSVHQLAERKYDAGLGVAVIDHLPEQVDDGDFDWQVLRDRLADSGAYLVLTMANKPEAAADAVQCVPWARPDLTRVLRARMSVPPSTVQLSALAESLAGSPAIRDVVELAGRLEAGEPVDRAVGHFDLTVLKTVTAWFDEKPSRRAILEVTTLAFAAGAGERDFEATLTALEGHLGKHLPEPVPTDDVPAEVSLPQRRHGLTGPGGLIVRRTVNSAFGTRGELVFSTPACHRHVLRTLWDRMEVGFWDAVRAWLDERVVRGSWRMTGGLATLAEFAFGEVHDLLDSWASGSRGRAGQRAAVLVVSAMVYRDELAPAALRIARWWSGGGAARRWTAALILSGDLAIRYPLEAVSRLWRLCAEGPTGKGNATVAFGTLFVTLTRGTGDAGVVLRTLTAKLNRFDGTGGNVVLRSVAVSATLAVLSAREWPEGRHAFLIFLGRHPGRVDEVARLWAVVLRYRPTRLRALVALRAALTHLAEHAADATERVARLGTALGAELTQSDRILFQVDLLRVAGRATDAVTALLNAFLTALSPNNPARKELR
ncbi:hypothetical protein [Amycolatopsis minnesotensis]|uniref:Uncharacterized protein n=1 Tax=Amycolatopsis minnesotensis TaxID=337894 RepID=A0ABP5CJ74_9PSEU